MQSNYLTLKALKINNYKLFMNDYPNSNAHFSGGDGQNSGSDPSRVVLLGPSAHLDLGDLSQRTVRLDLHVDI